VTFTWNVCVASKEGWPLSTTEITTGLVEGDCEMQPPREDALLELR